MKKHIPLLGAACLTFTLTSCYMPPGGYYPPGTGITPPGGITPPPGGITPAPVKKWVVDSYRITAIRVYKLPLRKSGTIPWDPSFGNTKYPDVYAVLKSSGRTIATTTTKHDHNPNLAASYGVSTGSLKFATNRRIHVGFFDRDKSKTDEIGGYNITVPTPATRQTKAFKNVKYRNSNGDLLYSVYFSYTWVLR